MLVTLLSGLWGIANPPFAGPDEPAHVKRAVALDHGELTGEAPSGRIRRELGNDDTHLVVRVPEIIASAQPCFAFAPNTTAACIQFSGSTRDTDTLTTAGRHPPAYYAVVGVASLVHKPGAGTVYLMRLINAVITGAFIATAITALQRTAAPRVVATGLLVAITPMVLFVSGVVNPSVPEIAAAIALWVCGLVLVSQSDERIDNRLVTAVGISACVLALSRQLSPLWLGLIALIMLAYGNRASIRNIARSSWARLWGALVAACALAQVGWVVVVKPLDATLLGRKRIDVDEAEIVRSSLGATFSRYREMIGFFGWLDTPAPALTYLLWTVAIASLVILAVMWARRRHVTLLIGLVAATIVVPILLESQAYRDVGGAFWQGRYTLPLAVGIPILSAMSIAATERGRQLVESRFFQAVGAIVVIGSALAFAQNLRRYTVGYGAEVWYWLHPQWSPPLSALLLTVTYAIAIVAFVTWALAFATPRIALPRTCASKSALPSEANLS